MSDDFDWSPFLDEGEEVLWQGQPDTRLRIFLHGHEWFHVGFALFFAAAMTFFGTGLLSKHPLQTGDVNAVSERIVQIFAYIAIACAVPALSIFKPAADDRARRRRYRYAITNRRVLRVDAPTRSLMTQQIIYHETPIDIIGRTPKTVRVGPWLADGRPLWAEIPNPSILQARRGLNIAAFDRRKTIDPSVERGFEYIPANVNLLNSMNGYDDLGLELRMIDDAEEVLDLLEELIAQKSQKTP